MVDYITTRAHRGDQGPVEFVHTQKLINRELPRTLSFANALREVLRQDQT